MEAVPEDVFIPASQEQINVLKQLQEAGKLERIPENLSKTTANQLIKEAVADDPLHESQIRMLQERMAQHKIPKMSPDQLSSSLTQKDFTEIMKIQPRLVSDSVNPDFEDKNRSISR